MTQLSKNLPKLDESKYFYKDSTGMRQAPINNGFREIEILLYIEHHGKITTKMPIVNQGSTKSCMHNEK